VKRALLIGAGVLALVVPAAAQAFVPNDPLLQRQWYAPQDKAFDAFNVLPLLPTVRVAVIDSGVDVHHPDLRGQIDAARASWASHRRDRAPDLVAGRSRCFDDGYRNRGARAVGTPQQVSRAGRLRLDRAGNRAIRWAVTARG
jgi:hypothetical protein